MLCHNFSVPLNDPSLGYASNSLCGNTASLYCDERTRLTDCFAVLTESLFTASTPLPSFTLEVLGLFASSPYQLQFDSQILDVLRNTDFACLPQAHKLECVRSPSLTRSYLTILVHFLQNKQQLFVSDDIALFPSLLPKVLQWAVATSAAPCAYRFDCEGVALPSAMTSFPLHQDETLEVLTAAIRFLQAMGTFPSLNALLASSPELMTKFLSKCVSFKDETVVQFLQSVSQLIPRDYTNFMDACVDFSSLKEALAASYVVVYPFRVVEGLVSQLSDMRRKQLFDQGVRVIQDLAARAGPLPVVFVSSSDA